MIIRDDRGRFIKGNPGGTGRPRVPAEFKEKARGIAWEALERLEEIITNPNTDPAQVIAASRIVIERAYGRPSLDSAEDQGAAALTKLDLMLAEIDKVAHMP